MAGAEANVRAVLPLVVAELGGTPRTLVDVGCGPGAWVKEFTNAGIEAVGLDGPWAEPHLVIPREQFIATDLEHPVFLEHRFDMAVSIEVAEHLSPERGPSFVANLCALSDAVLFSAALPGTPGTRHINLRWQSYWIAQFAENGYGVVDCLRPALWETRPEVVGWPLAQGAFLFIRGARPRLVLPADVVHPGMHQVLTAPPRLREVLNDLPGALRRFAKYHAARLDPRA